MGGLCSRSFHLRDQRAFHLHTHWKSGSETIFKRPLRLKISNPKIGGFPLYKFPSNKPQSATPHQKEMSIWACLFCGYPLVAVGLRGETHQGTHRFTARAEERREGLLLRQPAVEVRLPQRGQALRIQPRGFGARSARLGGGLGAPKRKPEAFSWSLASIRKMGLGRKTSICCFMGEAEGGGEKGAEDPGTTRALLFQGSF